MKNSIKLLSMFVVILTTISCETEEFQVESVEKEYSYNVEDIYTIPSNVSAKGSSVSQVTYVIPTYYQGYKYDFMVTTLNQNGSEFNVTFSKDGKTYSSDFYVENQMIFPAGKEKMAGSSKDSFLECVASHEGTAVGFLTGACAGIASFIPGLQPLAFACAAETAVTASIVAADCASKK